jgi:hypothetical protein
MLLRFLVLRTNLLQQVHFESQSLAIELGMLVRFVQIPAPCIDQVCVPRRAVMGYRWKSQSERIQYKLSMLFDEIPCSGNTLKRNDRPCCIRHRKRREGVALNQEPHP